MVAPQSTFNVTPIRRINHWDQSVMYQNVLWYIKYHYGTLVMNQNVMFSAARSSQPEAGRTSRLMMTVFYLPGWCHLSQCWMLCANCPYKLMLLNLRGVHRKRRTTPRACSTRAVLGGADSAPEVSQLFKNGCTHRWEICRTLLNWALVCSDQFEKSLYGSFWETDALTANCHYIFVKKTTNVRRLLE